MFCSFWVVEEYMKGIKVTNINHQLRDNKTMRAKFWIFFLLIFFYDNKNLLWFSAENSKQEDGGVQWEIMHAGQALRAWNTHFFLFFLSCVGKLCQSSRTISGSETGSLVKKKKKKNSATKTTLYVKEKFN